MAHPHHHRYVTNQATASMPSTMLPIEAKRAGRREQPHDQQANGEER
jgi:hypothetical protein